MPSKTTALDRALDLAASCVLPDGRRWGDAATEIQWSDMRAVLDVDSSVRRHWVGRTRGYSKTFDAGIATSTAMLTPGQLPPMGRAYGLAVDAAQGRLLIDSMNEIVANTPELAGALEIGALRVTAPSTGCVFEVIPADGPSAFGLRVDLLVFDEFCQFPQTPSARQLVDAVMTALPKRPHARAIVITTPGSPTHFSRRVFEDAVHSDLWRVSETRGPAPWLSPRLLDEERRRLPESLFLRLFEGIWAEDEDRLTNLEDLKACVVFDGPQEPQAGRHYLIGLDLGVRRDRTVATVCHGEDIVAEDGRRTKRVVLDRIEVWSGSARQPREA